MHREKVLWIFPVLITDALVKTDRKNDRSIENRDVPKYHNVNHTLNYNLNRDIFMISSGSFTQLIWKNTEYFGIGRAVSRYGKLSVVANYLPAGNICGLFQRNVSPSTADKT